MSSLTKAIKSKSRIHRERTNVLRRGFLERKKDYQVRSAEYHRRQDIFKTLRKKVLDKNPNEFHFGMKSSQLVDGVHYQIRKDDDELDPDEINLMQSQDLKYIKYKRSIDLKKINKMQSELHFIDDSDKPKNSHVFFVDKKNETKKFDFSKKMKMNPELLKMGFNFANPDALKNVSESDIEASSMVKELKYRRLANRVNRESFLKTLADKMEVKRQLLNKNESAKKVKKGTTKSAPVYKWKTERKK